MKRVAAIGMLILHLGLFTEMHELASIPLLVEHYFEHREKVPEMSFFDFLSMHYKTDVPHDSTDMKLPFKDHSTVTTPIFGVPEQKIAVDARQIIDSREYSIYDVSFAPSTALDAIFQPPRA